MLTNNLSLSYQIKKWIKYSKTECDAHSTIY